MPFDVKKYKNTPFYHPEYDVPLTPADRFKMFFDEGEKPVWRVRGLTGQEIGKAAMASQKNRNVAAMFEAVETGSYQKILKMYKELAGLDKDKVPQEIAEALDKIVMASVEPKADLELVVLLCTRSAASFYRINVKIKELTEGGMMPGKPKGSGKKAKSKQA